MTAEFEPFQSEHDGQWYWRIKDTGNHKILGAGGEGFTSKPHVEESIANLISDIRGLTYDNIVVFRKPAWNEAKQRLLDAAEPVKVGPGGHGYPVVGGGAGGGAGPVSPATAVKRFFTEVEGSKL